jgi:TatD DNase family protein
VNPQALEPLQCFLFFWKEGDTMYVDVHNHLYSYGQRLDEALSVIELENILTLDCTIHPEDYDFSKTLASKHPLVVSGFGIHPMEVDRYHADLEAILPQLKEAAFIGEAGLDFFWVKDTSTYAAQRRVFEFLLKKSGELGKMINLHTKGAEEEVAEFIHTANHEKPVIHWYSGPRAAFDQLLALGCYFTIGVDILSSRQTREMVEILPLERILTETDGLDARVWLDGIPGFPGDIIGVVESIAQIKRVDPDIVQAKVYETTMALLNDTN